MTIKPWHVIVWTVIAVLFGFVVGITTRTPIRMAPKSVTATVGVLKMSGGKIVGGDSAHKTLTGKGMRLVLALMGGDSTANPFDDSCWFAIGDDSTTTDTSMTALVDTIPTGYKMCDSVHKTTTSWTWWKTWTTAMANGVWGEIGFWNDSAGTMLDRRTGAWGTKTTADTFITYFKYSVD